MFRDINFVISVNSVVPMMHTKKFLAPVNVFCGVLVTKYDFNIRDKKQMYESHNGMSMIVVTPPAAAAWVAVTYPPRRFVQARSRAHASPRLLPSAPYHHHLLSKRSA